MLTSIMWSLPPAAPLTAKQKRVDSCIGIAIKIEWLYNYFSCLLVAFHLELDEGGGVALDWLRHLALHAVQLHCSHHSGKKRFILIFQPIFLSILMGGERINRML